ncbi:2-hydroxyacyl-CoA dehydratase [Treponema zioleckii]|uniref:2-hydroxyacyl-CoA dehydratase n=1 Tax=Treponema zioleckii TaxID=331680 RepID=UPI00168AC087|nr:2-hydroxyacyl-CoA dehydratase [Treponema zioleckii]
MEASTLKFKPAVMPIRIGIDVGSTTVKVVCLDENDKMIYGDYQRHRADIRNTIITVVTKALEEVEKTCSLGADHPVSVKVTGSGGLSVSQWLNIPFIQEVVAATTAVKKIIPQTDVVIELGGEDAKITYFTGGVEQRMNGTCAGGTGAFIDQMAALLETDAPGLNELARTYKQIYPIAARCGVFAKTDVQPLINEGARREDIAASIFQAVVNQTISGLACGKPIRGNVAFLGGPLHFLEQLRQRFVETLKLSPEATIVPENSQLFVAAGSAYSADKVAKPLSGEAPKEFKTIKEFKESLTHLEGAELNEVQRLEPLFKDEADLQAFRERHAKDTAKRGDLKSTHGPVFLGLDAGSTTTKAVLINKQGEILWDFYDVNGGSPVDLAVRVLKDLYKILPSDVYIARAVSTGYGEALFQAALGVDAGEVETITHYRAAEFFVPGVEFLLDIGGQDMKCLRMKDGAITSIQLNEACSAGCGSFLANFANSMNLDIKEFSKKALLAKKPVDLGSRCTVFMNSRVKQAQKEGATIDDISAGLSYSVIKNALFKVIKLRRASEIGSKVVVQGGTFYNDAVLRAFEKIAGVDVFRPDVAGLMGAYGSALIAYDQWCDLTAPKPGQEKGWIPPKIVSNIATLEQLETFKVELELTRCGGCQNNCLLTINTFRTAGINGGEGEVRQFITGNRCEKGLERHSLKNQNADSAAKVVDGSNKKNTGVESTGFEIPNLFDWKYKRLFTHYVPLRPEEAPNGSVGIPRVLNMYENYPMWFTIFTKLGFQVKLSPRSSHMIYERGMESIPSESVCYPAKISHGHIESLIKMGCKFIFYPCIPYEKIEDKGAGNHYNCPVVTSYPEVLKHNLDNITENDSLDFMNPFLPIYDLPRLRERFYEEIHKHFPKIAKDKVFEAVDAGWREQEQFKFDVQQKAEEALEELVITGGNGIVLAGRPYHLDPEINHGIPEMIHGLGIAVFTEDSVAHLGSVERPLRIIDQWTYHNRLYRAANFVSGMPNLELVQLTSFGCGLDAVTADQVDEIMKSKSRMYTLIKIDEGSNLGAVRIRIRSLIAAVKARMRNPKKVTRKSAAYQRVVFTEEMKHEYTILAPQMSPIHFRLLQKAFQYSGYNFVVLDALDPKAVDTGLKFVNNDACYPSILVTGQMIEALQSGKYDLNKVALMITQTGGGCRATNYIGFIRRALNDAGWGHIPVISLNALGLEKNPGFTFTPGMVHKAMMSAFIGDLLMRVLYRVRPYEAKPGSADALYEKWNARAEEMLKSNSIFKYKKLIKGIIRDFDRLPILPVKKPRVGVVGEILVKFHPTANNNIVKVIEAEGAECVMPDLMDFLFYTFSDGTFRYKELAFPKSEDRNGKIAVWALELYRTYMKKCLRKSRRFEAPNSIWDMMKSVDGLIQLGNISGEGWFLTAEMVELIKEGVPSIACIQPFACLPNHITGKGMIKALRKKYPGSNISAIDYDPGASEVNQLNRLKLLLSNAPIGKNPDELPNGKIWTPKGEVEPTIQYAAGATLIDDDPVDAKNVVPATTAL